MNDVERNEEFVELGEVSEETKGLPAGDPEGFGTPPNTKDEPA